MRGFPISTGLFILGIWLIILPLGAQHPFFKKINLPREFIRHEITCMYQDRAGFLWLGTGNGLYRYKGSHYQRHNLNDSLHHGNITSLFEDLGGKMWAGYEDGFIAHLRNSKLEAAFDVQDLPSAAITQIAEDKSGKLWFSTYGEGLYWWQHQKLQKLTNNDLADQDIYDMVINQSGSTYLGTDEGIMVLENQQMAQLIGRQDQLPDNIINTFSVDHRGHIWVATYDQGFCKLDPDNNTVEVVTSEWQFGVITDLQWAADQLWIGTERHGLIQYDPSSENFIQHLVNTTHPAKIDHILLDKDHNLWLAHDNSLFWVQPGLFFLDAQQNTAFQNVTAIGSQDNGGVWFANDKGLFNYQNGECTGYLQSEWAELGPVNTLVVSSQQSIWMGTWNGLYKYDVKLDRLQHFQQRDGLVNDNILSLAISAEQLWVATLGGVSRVQTNGTEVEFENFQDKNLMGAGYVYHVFVDQSGQAWFGTDGNGLILWDGDTFRSFAHQQPDSSLVIYSITEDNTGRIWFTTPNNGLFSFDGAQFEALGLADGLRATEIDALGTDSKGNLLLVHELGFDLLNPVTRDLMYFGEESGIEDLQVGLNNLTVDHQGNLWIGGLTGITSFHQWHESAEMSPQTIIDQISIFLEPSELVEGVVLDYDQNHISFEYASNWYQNLDEITYQTKLEGHDLDWNSHKSQSVTYPKLAPGNYTFMVRSSINDLFDRATVASFNFTIAAPWWQQLGFQILAAVLVLFGLVWWIRHREQKLRSQEQLKKDLVQTQLETLRSQVNPHFLFNSFNTLAGIIEEDANSAVSYVEQLSDFFRSTLAYRDQQLIPLAQELELVRNYTYLQKQRYGQNLSIKVEVRDDLKTLLIPPLTIQLLVENAIKHNVVSNQKPLEVLVLGKEDYLYVRNNKQLKPNKSDSTSFGLFSIVNRYKLLNSLPIKIEQDATDYFEVGVPLLKIDAKS